MTLAFRRILLAAALLFTAAHAGAEGKGDYADELPRFPPVEPEDALDTMEVAPGFRIELVAAEPLVHDPVAMAFDARSRLWVVEMRGYSEQRDERRGAVRVLEDTDGDGAFDQSTVVVDGLRWPTAVACWDGGAFVAVPPDIRYYKDTDGDGKADVRRRVFTGFRHENVQAMVNSFRWGLDNRIHGATSSGGAKLRPADEPEDAAGALELRLRDFAFDPRTLTHGATTEGGQHGMGFDDWGRKFSCSNSDHLKQIIYPERYLARNRWLRAPDARVSIAAAGRQPEVFRISPVEPWRRLRTRLRLEGKLMQFKLEGGGRAAGYFTAATGITLYRGDAWPEKFRGLAVIGDVGSNLIHRNRLAPQGIEFVGRRIDVESEFVASRDTWFRPVQFANGPDGNLYVADMYREIIEHPWSFGDVIKRHLDLTSGRDRGRIYRIVHTDAEGRKPRWPRPAELSSPELVDWLAHDNAWHRETAARLLYERRDPATVSPLRQLTRESDRPLGRMHAAYALAGLGALRAEDVRTLLDDPHPDVRRHAVEFAERFAESDPAMGPKLAAMADDGNPHVRMQLAFTLGAFPAELRSRALARLARRDPGSTWIRTALLSSLGDGADRVFAELAGDEAFRRSAGARKMMEELAELVARKNDPDEFTALLEALGTIPAEEEGLHLAVALGIRQGVGGRRAVLERLTAGEPTGPGVVRFREALQRAWSIVTDTRSPVEERIDSVRLTGLLSLEETLPDLEKLLGGAESVTLQRAVLDVLGRSREEGVTAAIVGAFSRLSPELRGAAMESAFSRRDRYPRILDAVERGDLNPGDLSAVQVQRLCRSDDEALRRRALRLLSPTRENDRSRVIERYRKSLTRKGDAERGREWFRAACSACHRAEGSGNVVGPNPATFRNRGKEWMLINILDPNREVNPEYANYTVTTRDGREIPGLITTETPTSVTVTRADGSTGTVLRTEIEKLEASPLSLMPEGLEQALDPRAMADLLAYLARLD